LKLDSSKARMRLGWLPTWGLEQGLDRVVEWYRGHGEGADARELTLAQIRAFEGNFEPILASG
ncbi:MAG: CDP-glucose 4,6-dehydratase, partial [Solirubrobacteraceae bacterium]|nr:CDP-glucose 4,6-dehydratase [Solirubrobacteraceae bacterium]